MAALRTCGIDDLVWNKRHGAPAHETVDADKVIDMEGTFALWISWNPHGLTARLAGRGTE